VNTYSIYTMDIKPKGFSVIELDGYVTDKAIRRTRDILKSPEHRKQMVEHNYNVATRYYSYSVLHRKLKSILPDIFDCMT